MNPNKVAPFVVYNTVNCALSQFRSLNIHLKQEYGNLKNVPDNIYAMYTCANTALENMLPLADCILHNCNRARQILIDSDLDKS